MLQPLSAQVHTLTYDNGKEFAYHMEIAKVLKANGYSGTHARLPLSFLEHAWPERKQRRWLMAAVPGASQGMPDFNKLTLVKVAMLFLLKEIIALQVEAPMRSLADLVMAINQLLPRPEPTPNQVLLRDHS